MYFILGDLSSSLKVERRSVVDDLEEVFDNPPKREVKAHGE
jgi:hypothetical protein